jgi:toxin ParE1/3/4
MEVGYHPLVKADVLRIQQYYHGISRRLANEFEEELRETVRKAASNPLRSHMVERGFRRVNLGRFPYHILYEIKGELLRVMIVRHNKRHPNFGLSRN